MFGPLNQFIQQESVTDLNYNGVDLWVDDLYRGRYVIRNYLSHDEIYHIVIGLSNHVNKSFNPKYPVLESEINDVRMSIIHPSITGKLSLSLRKTTKRMRLQEEAMINEGYITESGIRLLKGIVQSHCNILVSGLPGSGKTELIKYLSQFIPVVERIITIEDSYELYLDAILPNHDTISMKVDSSFNYASALKSSLRQRPNWILMNEVRGNEILDLTHCARAGTHVMSTIHAQSAARILDRLKSMICQDVPIDGLFDIGIHIEMYISDEGVTRYIKEIVFFGEEPEVLYTHTRKRIRSIPKEIRERGKAYGVTW